MTSSALPRHACLIMAGICLAVLLTPSGSARTCMVTDSTDHARTAAAITRAVTYLWRTQVTAETEHSSPRASFEGDWNQFLGMRFGPARLVMHDTGPFIPSFVCVGLQHLSAGNAVALGISEEDSAHAREICARVARLVERFEGADGTVAYWPEATAGPTSLGERLQAGLIRALHHGPALHGTLAPRGVRGFPPEFRIWPDPDCTAMSWVARWVNARMSGTTWRPDDPLTVLTAFSNTGKNSLYFPVKSVPPVGVYYGFCVPKNRPDIPRDVDLIVNCNILYAFALLGAGGRPEAKKITQWILDTVQNGKHRNLDEVTLYYGWENVLPYVVTRCYKDGGVKSLAPAAKTLAAEVRTKSIRRKDGTVYWEGSSPVRATAFALLALLNNGERDLLVEGAVRYLLAKQDSRSGCWHDRWVPLMQTPGGRIIHFRSDAEATAFAIEALCRYQLDYRSERPRSDR